MLDKNAEQEQSKNMTENPKQFRNAVIVYAIVEFFVIAVFLYKILR